MDPKTNPQVTPQKVRAVDVAPYHWAQWCSIAEDDTPFANEIVGVRWAEDSVRLVFMLESHNFMFCDPDELLELIPLAPNVQTAERGKARHAEVVARRLSAAQRAQLAVLHAQKDELQKQIETLADHET